MCKIFLDDVREPKDCLGYMYNRIGKDNPIYDSEWIIARNYEEFIEKIEKHFGYITHISYDHDLAPEHYAPEEYWGDNEKSREYQDKQVYKERTGQECAIWMKNFYDVKGVSYPIMYVHSQNPVGAERIINVFKNDEK